jgi:ABC-2 type transport system permease protein
MLSGFLYAIENMPVPIQIITHVVPARYFVTIVRAIFLKGVGLNVLWVEVLFLVGFSAIVFWLAERRMRQKLA